ncbi:MAG: CinA family protein [Clostridia bacterium]|nr:CinA family protein [Clostridia bacterium]
MNAQSVVDILKEKNLTLSTAESCTGGMIGELITSVSGASEVYGFGFITYANEAKEQILGVKHETLERFGAVSEETAREMALGAKRVSGSDISVSVTGIAGPGGGTKEKPVGLVYTAICFNEKVETFKLLLKGDRESVRKQTCEKVFENIINCAQNL